MTPSPYLLLSHVKNEFSVVELTACQCENGQSERESVQGHPVDLFSRISVLQGNFCRLGDGEVIICP